MESNPITEARELIGLQNLATELKVSYQAVRKWEDAERLPRTEYTGETNYAETIERLTSGKVTKARLLAMLGKQLVT